MDILLPFGVFLFVYGLGKLAFTRANKKRLDEAHKQRDEALARVEELHRKFTESRDD